MPSFPFLSGFGAGYPDYPWFFGTDGAYTTFSLSAVGQWEEAKKHLATIRQVSQLVNGTTGKVLHEIVTDGSIYFGTNAQNGDVNETAEFATAVATLWRWSGDNSVRDDNYDFIKAGLNYITSSLVTANLNPDGWPEGAGMVEANGMGALKLDVAVYTIRALHDLAEMADSKGDSTTRDSAIMKASALTNKFRQDWWIPSQGLFADSLALSQKVPTDPNATLGTSPGYTQLEQLFWINATPMETSFASVADASNAFPQLESSTFTGTTGFFQQGMKGGFQASAVNTGVMAIAEANYGRMDQSLRYVSFVANELDVEQPVHYRNYSTVRITSTSAEAIHLAGLWSCKPGLPMAFTGRWWSCTLGSSRMLPQKLWRSCQTCPVPGRSFRLTICTSAPIRSPSRCGAPE
jgi:hypothetical protein